MRGDPHPFNKTPADISNAFSEGRGSGREAILKHDKEIIRRRNEILKFLRKRCKEEKIHPSKLTEKILTGWMEKFPEQFFGIKTYNGLLYVYFLSALSTIKDRLQES